MVVQRVPGGLSSGIDIGSTVADLQAANPAVEIGHDAMWFGDSFRVAYPDVRSLRGTLTGPGAGDKIVSMIGGFGCGE